MHRPRLLYDEVRHQLSSNALLLHRPYPHACLRSLSVSCVRPIVPSRNDVAPPPPSTSNVSLALEDGIFEDEKNPVGASGFQTHSKYRAKFDPAKGQRQRYFREKRIEKARRVQEASKLNDWFGLSLKTRAKKSSPWSGNSLSWDREAKKITKEPSENLLDGGVKVQSRHIAGIDEQDQHGRLNSEARHGRVRNAQELARAIVERSKATPDLDVYSNLILSNVGSTGSAAMVASLLEEMNQLNILKDASVYENALKALAVHPDALLRGQILSQMRDHWFNLSASSWHFVVAGYLREKQFEMALEALDDMRQQQMPVQTWLHELTIATLLRAKEFDEALALLQHQLEASIDALPKKAWFAIFDVACESLHMPLVRFSWLQQVDTGKLNPSKGQCEQILHAAALGGDADLGLKVFYHLAKQTPNLELSHHQLLMEAYAANGDLRTSLRITQFMDNAGLLESSKSFWPLKQYLLKSTEDAKLATAILQGMTTGWKIPTVLMNALIETCVDSGNVDDAIDIYHQWVEFNHNGPNVDTFNTIFRGCALERRKEPAITLAHKMVERNIVADVHTYEHLIRVCLAVRDHETALRYFTELKDAGFVADTEVNNAIITRFVAIKDERAWSLLEDVKMWRCDTTELESWMSESWRRADASDHGD